MKSGYFYSPSTKLWVAREPLKVDARLVRASRTINLPLHWDDEGHVNMIRFSNALLLLKELGAKMMTEPEYWQVRSDAFQAGDMDMIKSLESNHYAEWLNTIFKDKEHAIHNIEVHRTNETISMEGKIQNVTMPYGHPGWFNADDIDQKSGLPKNVDLKVHLSDAFQCLGVRPCCSRVEMPEIKITKSDQGITLCITEEGEVTSELTYNIFTDKDSWNDTL